ncbi:MAG: phosphatidate cytidylyltransferase [Micrococcales bacterium]|nr:phosphatidate cytidylyltransferase [Micrococcales bacterium]
MASPGRNLPAAIGVAIGLIALLTASLAWRLEPFVALTTLISALALWELTRALNRVKIVLPFIPLAVGGAAIQICAFVAGLLGVMLALGLTIIAGIAWLALELRGSALIRACLATVLAALYIPLLVSFMVLIALLEKNGRWLVLAVVALPAANDTGGYLVGSLIGRHKLAPAISPAKTWEGLAGSVVATSVVAVAAAALLGHSWWAGIVLGLLGTVTSTVGDLAESLLKRQLGVKDMGKLLPGHGGVLDRVDSILATAPVAYAVLTLL